MTTVPDDQPGSEGSWMSQDNICGGCQWLGSVAICRGEADWRCCMAPKPVVPRCPTCGQVTR